MFQYQVGGKEVSGTSMRDLLGSDKFDDSERQKLFKKMFGYYNKGLFTMMTNKFKKLFESIDSEDMIWEPSDQKKPVEKIAKKDIIKGQNEDMIEIHTSDKKKDKKKKLAKALTIGGGLAGAGYLINKGLKGKDASTYKELPDFLQKTKDFYGLDRDPTPMEVIQYARELDTARGLGPFPEMGQVIPVGESINLPVDVGDTVLMGKFKNKKVVIKTIDFNEKGDVLINGRPALKFRMIKEFFEKLDMKGIIKEATSTSTDGGAVVDDGPSFGFGGLESYIDISEIQAKKLGFKIVDFIMKTPTDYEPDIPVYKNDGSVSYGPAGVGTGRTPNNQVDLTGGAVWKKWGGYINKIATTSGMKFVKYLLDKDIIKQSSRDTRDTVKTRNQENPPETPERKYVDEGVFTKEWWKEMLFEVPHGVMTKEKEWRDIQSHQKIWRIWTGRYWNYGVTPNGGRGLNWY